MAIAITADTAIIVCAGEHHSLTRAARVLARDIARITGQAPSCRTDAVGTSGNQRIVILSADNPEARRWLDDHDVDTSAIEDRWEAYLHAIVGGDVIICGADPMGTLRGIYAFGRDQLGIDPWIRWTGIEPEPRTAITIDIAAPIVVMSPTFRFRGWFLNNAHLINWNMGDGPIEDLATKYADKIDQGLSGNFGPEMTEMVAETCLRLEMNFLIPLSCWKIDDPQAKVVADVCDGFGLYMSFHHLEPVGANLRDWEEFWTARGEAVPEMSFGRNPEAFETWWAYWIGLWAQYDRVIWTIGHRGPGDRRYWVADPYDPGDNVCRGQAIANAMKTQRRLIREATGDREIVTCATLWQEGSELHADDLLEFPEKTMVIMADHGGKQMMREDFFFTRRRENLEYGVYYHACYGPGGPHWAQATNPAKMWLNLKQLIERNETAIALLNTGSIRTYLLGIDTFSRITTRGAEGFKPEQYLVEWCTRSYGAELAEEAAEAYTCFFYATIAPWRPGFDGARGFWDTLLQCEMHAVLKWIYHRDVEDAFARKSSAFEDAQEFLRLHRNACAAGLSAWDTVCERAHALEPRLTGARLDLLVGNFCCQAELMRAFFYGMWHICRAGLAMRDGDTPACVTELGQARERIGIGLQYWADNGNRPPFRNWIRSPHDIKAKGESTLNLLDDLLLALESNTLRAHNDTSRPTRSTQARESRIPYETSLMADLDVITTEDIHELLQLA